MICCLNPHCPNPVNRDTAEVCRSCGTPLVSMLRGRYQPVKLIGRGGFGRTYLAFDSDRLNAPCVIKQFAPQTQGTKSFNKAVTLFNQEAMRLHELGEHPQIPALLAYFEHEHYLYLVQQFIDGKTLIQEMLAQGPMDEFGIQGLLRDVLPVLDFIHRRNVIHRDITPSNLIRRETDRRLFVIDFGVAKQFGEALTPEPGTRIGTEGYAPIEQIRAGQAYPSSDLYSLGATCLHLLTGQKPENLYDPLEGRWRWRDVLATRGVSISEDLAKILDRLVLDMVGDRFQTAEAVLKIVKSLSKLQGNVPGWVRQHPSGKLSNPPVELQSTSSVPITSPIPNTLPPSNPPQSQPSSVPPAPPPTIAPVPMPPLAYESRSWQCARTLTGHESWVTAVAFNPRTATLVSGSLDDRIKVWNLQQGTLQLTLNGHPRGVNDVSISAKGQVLASCGDDGTVKIWDLAAGRRLHILKGHVRDVTSVAIGHKGWILASGSKDKSINLWKLDKGTLIRTLLGSPAAVRAVAMTPDETHLLSGGLDNKVRLWDLKTGQMVRLFSGHVNPVNDVAVSRDGLFVASASKDSTVRIWSIATGAMVHCLTGHSREVNSVAIAPDNRTIVTGSTDRTIGIWDAKTGKQLQTLTGHSHGVNGIAIHRTGRLIASASADKTIRIWKLV
ncbi:MAG: serine/threonine-protein kinase [Cyanobacteria bacterium P01_F01_bin.86]